MKRRTFFGLILSCLGLARFSKAKPVHTSGYAQGTDWHLHPELVVRRDNHQYLHPLSESEALMRGQKAFLGNQFLSRVPPAFSNSTTKDDNC